MTFPNEFLDFQIACIDEGKAIVAENVKIVLYKILPDYFELLDFENDDLFLEPLLFAQINSNVDDVDSFRQILYGSIEITQRPQSVIVNSDRFGNIYLPRLGWIPNVGINSKFLLENKEGSFFLNGQSISIEPLHKGNKLNTELVKYPVALFDDRFYDRNHSKLDVSITEPSNLFGNKYDSVLDFISEKTPWLAEMITRCCFKSVIFDDHTDPENAFACKRNSFASFMVKCISFHNVYQSWYDEVFFLDDISHQMGHVIFDFLTFDKQKFYKIDPNTVIKTKDQFGQDNNDPNIDDRTHEILFHALYTYFLTLNVLDDSLELGSFSESQIIEIKGRISFYISKCAKDFETFEAFDKNEYAANVYTDAGLYIYKSMKLSFSIICEKYSSFFNNVEIPKDSYNYNHKRFLKINNMNTGVIA